jgi:hypothetical protein
MTEVLYTLDAAERERIAALRAEGRFFWLDISLSETSREDLVTALGIHERALSALRTAPDGYASRAFHADGEAVVFALRCYVERRRSRSRLRNGAAVYGSFLVASVVGATFEAGADARTLTGGSTFVSMLVFWLAHVWSEVVGEHVSAGTRFHSRVIPVIARREWPLVQAAAVPTALLALAWAGVWSRETGAALALGSAILQIPAGGSSLGSLRRVPAQRRHPRRRAGDAWRCPAGPGEADPLIRALAAQSHKACDDHSPGRFADWRVCR